MTEELKYMCKTMRITQNYNGSYSHYGNSHGNPKDYPIDEAGYDTRRSWFYAPCKVKVVRIYGVGNRGTNTIWLQSVNKVKLANNRVDYVTIMCIHSNDEDLRKFKVGDIYNQGSQLFREGTDGLASGNHIHVSVGLGKIKGNGWCCNSRGQWVIRTTGGAIRPQDAFIVDENFTTVKSNGGINFKFKDFNLKYYPKCSSKQNSIQDGLIEIGEEGSFSHRMNIAKANNIQNYEGTASQNGKMLQLLKQGKLIKC